jgi:hypothetical protein
MNILIGFLLALFMYIYAQVYLYVSGCSLTAALVIEILHYLQPPVIRGTGFTMRSLDINLGDSGVMFYHIKRAVAKQRFQGEYIPTGPQIGDRKSMPETVRVALPYAGLFTQRFDQLAKCISIDWSVKFTEEKRGIRIFPVLSLSQITPEEAAGRLTQENNSSLASFCLAHLAGFYCDLSRLEVNVSNQQRAQFASPHSTIQQG